jgi:hypothetical protein
MGEDWISWNIYTNSLSLANFVGSVVGFLNVLVIRLRSLLLAAALSFESEMVLHAFFVICLKKSVVIISGKGNAISSLFFL